MNLENMRAISYDNINLSILIIYKNGLSIKNRY